jgi:hypothetical protein
MCDRRVSIGPRLRSSTSFYARLPPSSGVVAAAFADELGTPHCSRSEQCGDRPRDRRSKKEQAAAHHADPSHELKKSSEPERKEQPIDGQSRFKHCPGSPDDSQKGRR